VEKVKKAISKSNFILKSPLSNSLYVKEGSDLENITLYICTLAYMVEVRAVLFSIIS